ncbi:MAG: tRNA preQ1(34) S-adenosylmethionine ribosyltransferase-isomerase QueA [Terracidiphilus sp.]|jgi:S-adenosylmethionine:tRNA ribosyltransferase-isomerase
MSDLRVQDFDYDLPPELIAQEPLAERGASRMLVLDRHTGAFRDSFFSVFGQHLQKGDLLVLNDSRVIPARLFARRTLVREREKPGSPTAGPRRWGGEKPSGRIEVMLTEPVPDATGGNHWRALVRPSRKVAIGERLVFPAPDGRIALEAEVLERGKFGERLLEFAPVDESIAGDFFAVLDRIGHVPLPPYIHRDDAEPDRDRYQTVFAREPGSVAAPTAGLHFTPSLLADLAGRGVEIAHVTLHVGLGTFAPLRVSRVDEVRLHRERYSISEATARALNRAVGDRRRIVAVGTTVVRTLESAALSTGDAPLAPHSGSTDIFISPGFEFRLVGALLTNFHLPRSSLLMLVSAFAGPERVLAAYRHAIAQKYRFFSYGDCMFVQ